MFRVKVQGGLVTSIEKPQIPDCTIWKKGRGHESWNLVGCAANGNPLHSVQRRSIRCTPPDARGDCRDCSPSRVRCTPRFRSKSLKHLDKYALGFCHSPTRPRGAVTRTDENGGLDKVGKLEVDPQRIRGRSSVGALRSPSVNLVRTWTIVAEVGVDGESGEWR